MTRSTRPELTQARQAWRLLHGNTKAAAARRSLNDKVFSQWFPRGHDESLRPLLEAYVQDSRTPLLSRTNRAIFEHIHPDAFELITAYGVDYVPQVFGSDTYDSPHQPRIGGCFRNAHLVMHAFTTHEPEAESPMAYVEGLALGPNVPLMLHAWNTRAGSSTAYDWTLYATVQWTRYLGVPFTRAEYEQLRDKAFPDDYTVSFFRRERFLQFKPHLLELLENRKP